MAPASPDMAAMAAAAGNGHEVNPDASFENGGISVPPLTEQTVAKIPPVLPRERVFPIQIGTELFKLSGASLSSDAPSYFSQYFLCQIETAREKGEDPIAAIKTLYIDRDPGTFRDIALHLQGYHVKPRDGTHFVRLFADAQFYSLPKLISQLYEENIFISIGHREFKIPRDVLTAPGNTPNYFSLGFGLFFSHPEELFPGLEREGLIRPPSIVPPAVPNRDADVFAELLRLLRGYPVHIRDETHRKHLLRDARYFHFKGLEQRLIPHSISYNPLRQRSEIALRLENVQKSGVGLAPAGDPDDQLSAWVNYARPFEDESPAELVLEIGGEATRLHFSAAGARAEFFRDTKARFVRLLEVMATKLNLPPTTQPLGLLMATGGANSQPATPGNTPLSEDLVRVLIEPETAIILDGKEYTAELPGTATAAAAGGDGGGDATNPPRKRRRTDHEASDQWTVKTGQWRLLVRKTTGGKSIVECVLVAVRIDAVSSELGRNLARGFLTG